MTPIKSINIKLQGAALPMQNAASEPTLTCFAAELRVEKLLSPGNCPWANPTTTNRIGFMVNVDVG
jgi:hypothetical protein